MQSVRIRLTDSRHMSIPSSPLGCHYPLVRLLFFYCDATREDSYERDFSDHVLLVECWF